MASQSPIKVSEATKERIRYIAALTDATQAQVVSQAVEEYAARHADAIQQYVIGPAAANWHSTTYC